MFSCLRWLRSQRSLLKLMCLLGLLEFTGIALGCRWALNCRKATTARFAERLDPGREEAGLTQPIPQPGSPDAAGMITAGVYIDQINAVSIRDLQCQLGFTIWFRWRTSAGLTPEELLEFSIVNGRIESREVEVQLQVNDHHYLRCRVVAEVTVRWELDRFPLDHQQIILAVEHSLKPRTDLQYLADTENCRISSRVAIPLWEVSELRVFEKLHTWQTGRGDPRQLAGEAVSWSQLRAIISLSPRSWGYHLKLFQCTYIAVAIALAAMLVPPHFVDPRFGLGVGGLFAAVANSWVTQELIPDTGMMTLADLLNFVSTSLILLTILISIFSLHLQETFGQQPLSKYLDRGCFLLLTPGYLLFQILVPWLAAG